MGRHRPHRAVLGGAIAFLLWCGQCCAGGIDLGDSLRRLIEADWIEQDSRAAGLRLAEAHRASKSSLRVNSYGVTTAQDAAGGCDGVKNGRWGFHTASGEQDPWWQVDLQGEYRLDRVVIFNRTDRNTAGRTKHIRILVAEEDGRFRRVYAHNGRTFYGIKEGRPLVVKLGDKGITARIVRLQVPGRCSFALDEVEVYATEDPEKNIALGKPAEQKSVGRYSYPGTLPEGVDWARLPGAAAGVFELEWTAEVVKRGRALLARLRAEGDARRLDRLATELNAVAARLAELKERREVGWEARRNIYLDARWLVRRIAFTNPVLDLDKILFIKRHIPGGVFHMCDQYYGCNARPGGGLFVLSEPFGANPKLTDLLENSVVQRGRLKGQKLTGGSFLSPEVSYDGKTILFAYTQAKAYEKYRGKEAYEWGPEVSYHIFKVNCDGTGLVQLTDGPWDDFDPCFLPNGRIAFISERRGGYLRCGRHCPTYTLHSMAADGSDIIRLSYHETHEWHPSVDNNGMIVYTRWDYVDRDTNIAHHIWRCFPDGRDPRSLHGNYPVRREARPWMEMSIRAIPGSHKFVATAAAHHGHAFGSLVLIDERKPDDGAMSQLSRLTPEVPFPEAEKHIKPIRECMVYATAWPLSEDDYLCSYDREARNHGIYWIDRFGNKELLYRDPSIPSLSPIPLRRRPRPPVIPAMTKQAADATGRSGRAEARQTITVINVYNSDFRWPEGAEVAALRIIQLLPKTTPAPNRPRIGVANQSNARAVLGTAPVEADGSAYFEAPAGKAIYFQALDARGMAIQSMRSVTYVHPGEQLTCLGCHEPKHRAPRRSGRVPLAVRRVPSKIRPDVDGSNPFNYVRLVQPVLDRNCVSCHREKDALDLSGVIEGENGWTRSYNNLAEKYGFYFHVSNGSINTGVHGGSRTIAGKFGARASGLLKYMDERHYGVELGEEDFHRLVLWLDCNCEFYGSYENTEAQGRGLVVQPSLD